jgi:spore coat protein H
MFCKLMMPPRCSAVTGNRMNEAHCASVAAFVRSWVPLLLAFWFATGFNIYDECGAAELPTTASDFFASTNLLTLQIELDPGAVNRLEQHPKAYVEGRFRVGESSFEEVGVRLKGSGTFQPLYDHPSLAVKFNWRRAHQRFAGLSKLFLENSGQDATRMCKLVANGAYTDAGLAAPRITQARVQVNGRGLGLYVISEAMNKAFLSEHFGSDSGNLYEADFRDVNGSLRQANGPPGGQSDLRALCRAAALPNRADRLAALVHVLETDQFLDYLAVEMILGNWDGYAFHQNNYRIYNNPNSGRMTFLPHDLDNTLFESGMCVMPPRKGLLTAALLDNEESRQAFRQRVRKLAPTVLDPEKIKQRVEASLVRMSQSASADECATIRRRADLVEKRAGERLQHIRDELNDRRPPTPQFDSFGVARLTGWTAKPDWNDSEVETEVEEDTASLSIKAEGGYCFGSWRLPVWLPAGRYRIEGAARASGVAGLPSQTGSGVGVRVVGSRRGGGIQGDCTPWTPVRHEFIVQPDCEWVELIAELRAFTGNAWFDPERFRLVHLK